MTAATAEAGYRKKAGQRISWRCAHAAETLYAGFPHLYFPAKPAFAEKFVKKACDYADRHP
jgi:cobyrinic acid a,c-diamide synthase